MIATGASSDLANPSFVERFVALTTADAPETAPYGDWSSVRGAGIAPLLHAQCEAHKLACVALLMACAEGDNVPDAVAMATHVATYLRVVPPSEQPTLPFVFPPSWSQLFGRGPDASLYL